MLTELFIRLSTNTKYWDKWRTSKEWLVILAHSYAEVKVFNFTVAEFNRAIAVDPVLKHCEIQCGVHSNKMGIYFDRHCRKGVRTTAIYCCAPNKSVRKPPTDAIWWEEINERTPSLRNMGRTSETFSSDVISSAIMEDEQQKRKKTTETGR